MKIKVDPKSDALYISLSEDPVENSQEVSPGVILDFNKAGKVVGIELLGIKGRFPLEDLSHFKVDVSTVA
jgi:uncharacterized protein YuzE